MAKVINYEGWEVTGHGETPGNSYVVGLFANQYDAVDAARGKGAWGSDGSYKFVQKTVVIYDSIEEYNQRKDMQKVNSILKGLKPDEVELLKKHFSNDTEIAKHLGDEE